MGREAREPRCDECAYSRAVGCNDPLCDAVHTMCMRYPPAAVVVPQPPRNWREYLVPRYAVEYTPVGVPAAHYCGEFKRRAPFDDHHD